MIFVAFCWGSELKIRGSPESSRQVSHHVSYISIFGCVQNFVLVLELVLVHGRQFYFHNSCDSIWCPRDNLFLCRQWCVRGEDTHECALGVFVVIIRELWSEDVILIKSNSWHLSLPWVILKYSTSISGLKRVLCQKSLQIFDCSAWFDELHCLNLENCSVYILKISGLQ